MTLYRDKNTNLIHEVKLFEDFALVRPLNPSLRREMQKVDLMTLVKYFEEYAGDHTSVYNYLEGADEGVILSVGVSDTLQ